MVLQYTYCIIKMFSENIFFWHLSTTFIAFLRPSRWVMLVLGTEYDHLRPSVSASNRSKLGLLDAQQSSLHSVPTTPLNHKLKRALPVLLWEFSIPLASNDEIAPLSPILGSFYFLSSQTMTRNCAELTQEHFRQDQQTEETSI